MLTHLWKRYGLFMAAGALCVLVNGQGLSALWFAGVGLLLAGALMWWTLTRSQRPLQGQVSEQVAVPVEGRWRALNGPGTKVPSHTHTHAQTYAIDLTYHPPGSATPASRLLWPLGRRPHHYPAFGSPVLAPVNGVVVATVDRERDHWTRTSLPGLAYFFAEAFVRSFGGRRHLFGNYVVLEARPGVYAVVAHLRRGSVRVAVGDRITKGDPLAECGNSGNSTEPHVHFQLMAGADSATARGLPFEWRYLDDEGVERAGVPEDLTFFRSIPSGTS